METRRLPLLLPLLGVTLLWTLVLSENVLFSVDNTNSLSLSKVGEERPHLAKRSTQKCGGSHHCLNGKCMLLVQSNEATCLCNRGFYGIRCETPEMLVKPMAEEQIVLIVFCVCLLIIGLAGALYFFFKWYKKNRYPRQQKQQGYRGVQLA